MQAARQLCGVTVRRKGDVFLPSLDKNKSPESKRRANQVYKVGTTSCPLPLHKGELAECVDGYTTLWQHHDY
jgi:hypothetical protein